MRQLRVDFNNLIGSGILTMPTHGHAFTVGEHLVVFDEETSMFDAVVLDVSGDTVFLRVSERSLSQT